MQLFYVNSSGKLRIRNGRPLLVVNSSATPPEEPPPPPPPTEEPPTNPTSPVVVALVDVANQRVYQRVGTSKLVPVTVNYSGGEPSAIEARAVDATTLAAVTSWQTINSAPANGVGSGLLNVPQGCWYRLEVRATGGAVTRGANKFGVGVLIGLIGQSNMENFPKGTYDYPSGDKRSIEYDRTGLYQRVGNIADTFAPNTRYGSVGNGYGTYTNEGRRGDGFTYLANLVAQALNVPVCLVERGAGGSAISSWMNTGADNNWAKFAAAINATGGDCEFAIWHQGETDANTMSTATMVARLGDLHAQLKTLTGRTDSTFHFGIVALGPGSFSGSSEGEFGNMRAAHVQYANTAPGAFVATCAHDAHTSDGVHIGGEAFFRHGRRYAKSVLARLGIGTSCAGPRAVGMAWDGSGVVLTVQHSGGSALLDGAGGTGSALTGFEFKDASGNLIPYTSSAITSATTIRFGMGSKPSTGAYAMMNNPHNTDPEVEPQALVLASVPYDNSTYLDGHAAPFGLSLVGAPLQPFPAMAVA